MKGQPDPAAELAGLIAKARQHDEQARRARQAAGLILLRSGNAAERQRLAHAVGLDARMVDPGRTRDVRRLDRAQPRGGGWRVIYFNRLASGKSGCSRSI